MPPVPAADDPPPDADLDEEAVEVDVDESEPDSVDESEPGAFDDEEADDSGQGGAGAGKTDVESQVEASPTSPKKSRFFPRFGLKPSAKKPSAAGKGPAAPAAAAASSSAQWVPVEQRRRTFELTFQVRNFDNVTSDKMVIFFAISMRSAFPEKRRAKVRMKPVFTTMYTLGSGESANLEKPLMMIQNWRFNLPYAELEKHVLQVDMWKVGAERTTSCKSTCGRTRPCSHGRVFPPHLVRDFIVCFRFSLIVVGGNLGGWRTVPSVSTIQHAESY